MPPYYKTRTRRRTDGKCAREDCDRPALPNSVYCSDTCLNRVSKRKVAARAKSPTQRGAKLAEAEKKRAQIDKAVTSASRIEVQCPDCSSLDRVTHQDWAMYKAEYLTMPRVIILADGVKVN